MSLVKGSQAKKTGANKANTGGTGDYKPAEAWFNLSIVRGETVFKMKRGVAVNEGDDPVYDALLKSERIYRDKCRAENIEYVPRTVTVTATLQLVDAPVALPDLYQE